MQLHRLTLAVSATTLLAYAANAADLPKTLAVTAYDVGSSGYSQAVAVGSAFKNSYGVTLRVLPGKNDISRTIPLREGKVDFSFNGVGTILAQEGVEAFGGADWGPQRVRMMLASVGGNCLSLFWAADLGVKKIEDLKGKRAIFVKGSPALQSSVLAGLQYGNLTWDDVEIVEVGGNAAAFEAVINNQADIFFSTTNSGSVVKAMTSPRGLTWPHMDPNNKEAYARVARVAPWLQPHECTETAGNPPPFYSTGAPYPIIMMYDTGDADLAYAVTNAMFEQYENYKDAAPAATGYALERQKLEWILPYHEGAIRYYKEKGLWKEEHQSNQEALLKRQDVLGELWKSYTANPKDNFYEGWMEARYAGLEAAGLDPYWRSF